MNLMPMSHITQFNQYPYVALTQGRISGILDYPIWDNHSDSENQVRTECASGGVFSAVFAGNLVTTRTLLFNRSVGIAYQKTTWQGYSIEFGCSRKM